MKVVEIFPSIDGEGITAGLPTLFIRLFGCNLNCSYCDTKYSHEREEENCRICSVDEIIDTVKSYNIPRVTVTGGEPMIHLGIERLLDKLLALGLTVNVETNGTVPVPAKYKDNNNIIFTMDYKCPTSGMEAHMQHGANLTTLRNHDVVKFVVGSYEDLNKVIEVLDTLHSKPHVFLSPVFGNIEPAEIVTFVLEHRLYNCRVQLQMHKYIWPPEMRGV